MKRKPARSPGLAAPALPDVPQALLMELRELIHQARISTVRAVDEQLCALYWRIGTRIRREILKHRRAEYGAGIVSAVGRQLEGEFGRGFAEKSIRHMIRFAEAFPGEKIVPALRRQLSWTHFKRLNYLEDPLKRDFYAQMCRVENWPTRVASYWTDALPRKPLQVTLHEAVALARRRLALQATDQGLLPDGDR